MNANRARDLKRYAEATIPDVVARRYPNMAKRFYRFLKEWWVNQCDAERAVLSRHMKQQLSPPESIKQDARQRGIIVEWPPRQGG